MKYWVLPFFCSMALIILSQEESQGNKGVPSVQSQNKNNQGGFVFRPTFPNSNHPMNSNHHNNSGIINNNIPKIPMNSGITGKGIQILNNLPQNQGGNNKKQNGTNTPQNTGINGKGMNNNVPVNSQNIGKKGLPSFYQNKVEVQNAVKNGQIPTNPVQKGALDKLINQQPITMGERQQVSNLLFQGNIEKKYEGYISQMLLDDHTRNGKSSETPANVASASNSSPGQHPLYIRVFNNSGERIKVFLQVMDSTKKEEDIETLVYDLEQGKSYDLQNNRAKIIAQAVKVWAISTPSNQSWAQHKDEELFLVSKNNSKTYTLTFSK